MEFVNSRKRFKKRVDFERQILSVINSSLVEVSPLNGLSESAITVWYTNVNTAFKEELCQKIRELAKDLMVYCDNSKNAFDIDKRINGNDLSKKIELLKSYLSLKIQ